MNTFGSGLEWVQKCSMDWKSRWRWTALSWNPEIALWSHPDPLTAFRLVSASHPDQAWCQQIIYDTVDSSATLHCRCLTPNESNLLCMEMYDKSIAFETPQTNFKASLLRRMQYVVLLCLQGRDSENTTALTVYNFLTNVMKKLIQVKNIKSVEKYSCMYLQFFKI